MGALHQNVEVRTGSEPHLIARFERMLKAARNPNHRAVMRALHPPQVQKAEASEIAPSQRVLPIGGSNLAQLGLLLLVLLARIEIADCLTSGRSSSKEHKAPPSPDIDAS